MSHAAFVRSSSGRRLGQSRDKVFTGRGPLWLTAQSPPRLRHSQHRHAWSAKPVVVSVVAQIHIVLISCHCRCVLSQLCVNRRHCRSRWHLQDRARPNQCHHILWTLCPRSTQAMTSLHNSWYLCRSHFAVRCCPLAEHLPQQDAKTVHVAFGCVDSRHHGSRALPTQRYSILAA